MLHTQYIARNMENIKPLGLIVMPHLETWE
jgi:hypothetical protein